MKNLAAFIVSILILSSCNGSGGGGQAGEATSPKVFSGATVQNVETEEITNLNNELNNENYSLEIEELDQLLSEGMINQEEYSELIALASAQGGQGE